MRLLVWLVVTLLVIAAVVAVVYMLIGQPPDPTP